MFDYFRSPQCAGYKHDTWWVHNKLGQKVKTAIPSCTLSTIRESYLSINNGYQE